MEGLEAQERVVQSSRVFLFTYMPVLGWRWAVNRAMYKNSTSEENKDEILFSMFAEWHVDKFRRLNQSNPNAVDYFEFPIYWDRSYPLVEQLYYIFSRYVEELKEFFEGKGDNNSNESLLKEVVGVCNRVLSSLRDAVEGKLLRRENLLWLEDKLADFPIISIGERKNPQDSISELKQELSLFRARVEKDLYERNQFYHVPFNKLYLCKSYRFSAAGTPCLYLGYSEEVCYAEIGGKKGSIVEYKVKGSDNPLRVLDFTLFGPYNGYNEEKPKEQSARFDRAMFYLWPILAACYVAVPREMDGDGSNFKEEYVFPQLLTRYLANKNFEGRLGKIDGFRYYSCRYKNLNPNTTTYMNVALFPKKEKGGEPISDISESNCSQQKDDSTSVIKPYDFGYDPYAEKFITEHFEVKTPHNS